MADALALEADEGRDEQRYALGSSKYALIQRFPNGGNPAVVMYCYSIVSKVAIARATR